MNSVSIQRKYLKHYYWKTIRPKRKNLQVTQEAILHRLKFLGIIPKQGNWFQYELKQRNLYLDVVYLELLKPNVTKTEALYRTHLMRFSPALNTTADTIKLGSPTPPGVFTRDCHLRLSLVSIDGI